VPRSNLVSFPVQKREAILTSTLIWYERQKFGGGPKALDKCGKLIGVKGPAYRQQRDHPERMKLGKFAILCKALKLTDEQILEAIHDLQ
jgi:hypothetical protein